MSEDWNTKYGTRRVRRDPPTLEEAIFAAVGITDDQQQQAEIAAALMGLPYEEVLAEVKKTGRAVTVEEGCLMGGFGSAVLEAANEMGLETNRIKRLGVPDQFIEHGERSELLADLGLNATGIAAACRELAEQGEGVASL